MGFLDLGRSLLLGSARYAVFNFCREVVFLFWFSSETCSTIIRHSFCLQKPHWGPLLKNAQSFVLTRRWLLSCHWNGMGGSLGRWALIFVCDGFLVHLLASIDIALIELVIAKDVYKRKRDQVWKRTHVKLSIFYFLDRGICVHTKRLYYGLMRMPSSILIAKYPAELLHWWCMQWLVF